MKELIQKKEDSDRLALNERFNRIYEILKKKKEKLSDEEYQIVKQIFHYVPEFENLPKPLWIILSQKLILKEVPIGDKLISKDDTDIPCCVILKGTFENLDLQKNQKDSPTSQGRSQLLPASACGNYQPLNDKRWKPADIVATEDNCAAAIFSAVDLANMLNEENSNAQSKALQAFLIEAIASFEQLSGQLRARLTKKFKERIFLPGLEIIQEGTVPTSAFLIREGECAIISRQNPVYNRPQTKQNSRQQQQQLPVQQGFMNKSISNQVTASKTLRGYMSLSINTYQLRTLNEKEWFGDEVLLINDLSNIKYEYSVVTKTKVFALEITKEDIKKFPADLIEWFKKNAKDKIAWLKHRKAELEGSIGKIYQMDPLTNFLEEAFSQVTKKFPQSNIQLKSQIHKQNFLSEEAIQEPIPRKHNSRVRPKSGILPCFNNLRTLMRAKKLNSQIRPMTATKESILFTQTDRQNLLKGKMGIHLASTGYGCKSTAQLRSAAQTSGPWFERIEGFPTNNKRILLDAASTFRMSYDKKAYFPAVQKKQYEPKKPLGEKERNKDEQIEKMKIGIIQQYDTFKVGILDIKAVGASMNNRPPSPNPVRQWAERHKVNLAERNNEIRIRTAAQQQQIQQ